jgi:hypothetical protein
MAENNGNLKIYIYENLRNQYYAPMKMQGMFMMGLIPIEELIVRVEVLEKNLRAKALKNKSGLSRPERTISKDQPTKAKCFSCEKAGHFRPNCPDYKKQVSHLLGDIKTNKISINGS